jgi:hypothetical protein
MIDQVIAKYIELRDRKAQLKAEYEAKVAPVQEAMDKAEAFILQKMEETGVTSFKTDAGTAYATIRTSASLADWDLFREFLAQQEDPFVFLDRRVNKTAIEEYTKDKQDLPPGFNWRVERTVGFRRS